MATNRERARTKEQLQQEYWSAVESVVRNRFESCISQYGQEGFRVVLNGGDLPGAFMKSPDQHLPWDMIYKLMEEYRQAGWDVQHQIVDGYLDIAFK